MKKGLRNGSVGIAATALLICGFLLSSSANATDSSVKAKAEGSAGGEKVMPAVDYEGVVEKIVAGKSEIYVKTSDGKTIELYFTDKTSLLKNGSSVPFQTLQLNQKVKVKAVKIGKRLDPMLVEIL